MGEEKREPVGSMKPVDFTAAVPVLPEKKDGNTNGRPKLKAIATPVNKEKYEKESGWLFTFFRNLFPGDPKNILKYTIKNYIEPAIKNGIVNAVAMKVYNDTRGYSGPPGQYNPPYQSPYSNPYGNNNYSQYYYKQQTYGYPPSDSSQNGERRRITYQDVVVANEDEAKNVIKQMRWCIEEYGVASLNDLFNLSGYTPNDHQEGDWGWTRENFRGVGSHPVFNGEKIDIPNPPIYIGRNR